MIQANTVLRLAVFAAMASVCFSYYDVSRMQECQCWERNKTCSATGDVHFTSFDGDYRTFQGDCTYLLAGVCCDDGWQVYVSASACGPLGATCVDKVIVKHNGFTIEMPAGGPATVSPEPPVDFFVTYAPPMSVTTSDGVHIEYNGNSGYSSAVFVRLPCKYFDRVCGLCGDADGNSGNDYRTSMGGNPTSVDNWGESYQIEEYDDESCDKEANPDLPVDEILHEVARLIEKRDLGECGNIGQHQAWGECLASLGGKHVDGLLRSCLFDSIVAKRSGQDGKGGCGVLEHVADLCAFETGSQRSVPDDCVDPCDPNPCRNGGTCLGSIGTNEYSCLCPHPFWGLNCQNGVIEVPVERAAPKL